METIEWKYFWLIIILFCCAAGAVGVGYYRSPEVVEKRHQHAIEKYMSRFTNATLLHRDTDCAYIYANNTIYRFSIEKRQAEKYLNIGNTVACDNGEKITASIQKIYFINKHNILLQINGDGTYHYVLYCKDKYALKFAAKYLTDSPERPRIHHMNEYPYRSIVIPKNGRFKEGGKYVQEITYSLSTSRKKTEIFSKETGELLGDERYLDYNFRQKEKQRKAEEARREEERKAERARQERLKIAIANAVYVVRVNNEFNDNEPAAEREYLNKRIVYKGTVKSVMNNNGSKPKSKYKIWFEDCYNIEMYTDEERVVNISPGQQIVFEGCCKRTDDFDFEDYYFESFKILSVF